MPFTTTAHISTIKNNSLILVSLLLSVIVITGDRFWGVIDIPEKENIFSKEVSFHTLGESAELISESVIYPVSSNKDIAKLNISTIGKNQKCNLIKKDKSNKNCKLITYKASDINQLIKNIHSNDGFCLNIIDDTYVFQINYSSICKDKGEIIKFRESVTIVPLTGLRLTEMKKAQITLRAMNNEKSRLEMYAIVQNIRLIHSGRTDTYSGRFDVSKELLNFQNSPNSSSEGCKSIVRTPSCFYEQLNIQTGQFTKDSVTIPYISKTLPSLYAVLTILLLILLTNFSTYTAAIIAMKHVNEGLDQNFVLLDSNVKYINSALLKIHTYSLLIWCMCFFVIIQTQFGFYSINFLDWNLTNICHNLNILTPILITIFVIPLISLMGTNKLEKALLDLRKERQALLGY